MFRVQASSGGLLGGGLLGGFSWGCLLWQEKTNKNYKTIEKSKNNSEKKLKENTCLICAFSGCFWGLLGGLLLPPWGALGGMEGKRVVKTVEVVGSTS